MHPAAPYFRARQEYRRRTPLSVTEAILVEGRRTNLDGARLSVKIPRHSGARLLRGKGISGGDQFIEIKIVVPAPVSDESKKLIEEFARLTPQNPRAGLW